MGNKTPTQFMGSQPPPEKLSEFKQLAMDQDQYNIPELPLKRQTTDSQFTFIFAGSLLALFILLAYSLSHSDKNRVVHGFDTCGNVCGEENDRVAGINCSGKDMTKYPLLQFDMENMPFGKDAPFKNVDYDDVDYNRWIYENWEYQERECVAECDKEKYIITMNRCFPTYNNTMTIPTFHESEDVEIIWDSFGNSFGYILVLIVISFGLCLGMLMLFRYAVAVVVWGIVIVSYSFLLILTLYLWFCNDDDDSTLTMAITFTIITLLVGIFLISMFKRIFLVINLFREATKATFAMPLIVFEPLLTFVALFVVFIFFMTMYARLQVAGFLTQIGQHLYNYQPSSTIAFTMVLNIIIMFWMIQFIMACQIMVISGAVSTWYFARDKTFLGSPIKDSMRNVIKYHLGTVALGSLIMTIIAIIKAVIRALAKNRKTKFLADICMGYMQSMFIYISRLAYIQTAMHGESFYKSGKRAIQLLCLNLGDVIALNSIGDFVLFMAKLLICISTFLFSIFIYDSKMDNYWAIVCIGALISYTLAHTLFSVFSTTVDTIFLCYCEDCCMNDGIDRPYYMSTELMQFFEESKATVINKV